ESPWGSFGWWGGGRLPGYPGKELKHGKLHDDSWSGLFRQIRAGNNDKTTVAGKGILLAMCHLSPFSCMAISSASQSETRC
ncbi:hypothetical protein, partial [Pseudomonas aeruginosa]|nr:hypothetical protein [Pseudomonas aeruginosa]MCU9467888.1 hypothetical protein [Pseudomonas aeruginosa]MCU9498864.1 hypothetical protein [Pseudomonas aeruginosa]